MPRPRHPCHTRLISPCATFAASVRGGGRGGRAAPCTPSPATTEGICHAAWRVWSLGAATAADVAHGHGLLVAREQLVVQLVGGASARARGRPGSAVTLLDSSRRGPDWRASRPEQTGAAQLRQHPPRRSSAARQHSLARQHFRGNGYRSSVYLADKGHCQPFSFLRSSSLWSCSFRILIIRGRRRGGTSRVASRRVAVSLRPRANHTAWCRR